MLTTEQINNANHAFITTSDIGCLSIGSNSLRINIHNLYGDTSCNHVYVFEEAIDISIKYYLTDINGTFDIYDYDCPGNKYRQACSCITLSGHYNIYRDVKTFVFVKI